MAIGTDSDAVIAAVHTVTPQILAFRNEVERRRGLPPALARALRDASLFHLLVPRSLGGREVDPVTWLHALEAVARIDGSVGWSLLSNIGGLCTAYLDVGAGRGIIGGERQVIGGTLVPTGRATTVPGGYRISGRWAFGSGVAHSDWMMSGCMVVDSDTQMPRRGADGQPEARAFFIPAGSWEVLDTWSVIGLRGTGSDDVVVSDCFVPAERSFSLSAMTAVHPGPLYAFPVRVLGAAGIAAVCLGIARGAVDALVALAEATTPSGTRVRLRERALVQAQLAQAEAQIRAARAFLLAAIGEVWETVLSERPVSLVQRAQARLAATYACSGAREAVDLMYGAGGSAALFTENGIERAFRDVHTATHHASIQGATLEMIGGIMLGLPPENPALV